MAEEQKNQPVNTYVPEQPNTPNTPALGSLNEQYQKFVADNTSNINAMYDAQRQSQLTGLESAYTQNLSDAQAQKDAIDRNYNRAANDLAVQYERNRANQNLRAQLSGLNVGVGSQMDLALGSEYNRDFGNLRGQQAAAQVEQDRQISNIEAQYRLAVQQAIADNDLARAAALVDEANNKVNQLTRAYQLQQEEYNNYASLLGSAGDLSGYQSMYGLTDDQIAALQTAWTVQNPDLAYHEGMISADEYQAITGHKPNGAAAGNHAAWLRTQLLNDIIYQRDHGSKEDVVAAIGRFENAFGQGTAGNYDYYTGVNPADYTS